MIDDLKVYGKFIWRLKFWFIARKYSHFQKTLLWSDANADVDNNDKLIMTAADMINDDYDDNDDDHLRLL